MTCIQTKNSTDCLVIYNIKQIIHKFKYTIAYYNLTTNAYTPLYNNVQKRQIMLNFSGNQTFLIETNS